MFNKDSYTDDPCDSYALRESHIMLPEIRGSRNVYERLDKFNKVQTSNQYLPKTKDDFNISTPDHFQVLNEKFLELESKMGEVESCFKEANKREMSVVERLMDNSGIKSPAESFRTIPRSHLFAVADSRKETNAADEIKEWFGSHTKQIFQNRNVKDGSGDMPKLSNDDPSTCKRMVKSIEKPPAYHSSKHGRKGLFTLNQFRDERPEDMSKDLSFEETTDAEFLEKSKKLILTLIDKELKKIEAKPNQSNSKKLANPRDENKDLKIECIHNIERELNTLRKLESLE